MTPEVHQCQEKTHQKSSINLKVFSNRSILKCSQAGWWEFYDRRSRMLLTGHKNGRLEMSKPARMLSVILSNAVLVEWSLLYADWTASKFDDVTVQETSIQQINGTVRLTRTLWILWTTLVNFKHQFWKLLWKTFNCFSVLEYWVVLWSSPHQCGFCQPLLLLQQIKITFRTPWKKNAESLRRWRFSIWRCNKECLICL